MNRLLRKGLIVLVLALLTAVSFSGCDLMGSSDRIEIQGTWTDAYSTLVITNTQIDFGSHKAEIVEYDNDSWNGGESGLASGNFGYAVIKYTDPPFWKPAILGKYMIFRWQDLAASSGTVSMSHAEGSDYPTDTYFDDAASAKAGATSANGFFGTFTEDSIRQ